MNKKKQLLIFSIFALAVMSYSNSLNCQTIYEFSYRSATNKAISNIKALMFNYLHDPDTEGRDFVRIRYYDSILKKTVILNLSLADSAVKDKNGNETDQLMILKTQKITTIRPLIDTPVFLPDLFLLSTNPNGDYLIPSAIITPNGLDSFEVTELSFDSLTPKKMDYYFDKSEPLYDELLNSDTRDDHQIPAGAALHFILIADTDDDTNKSSDYLDFRKDKEKLLDFYTKLASSLKMPLDTSLLFYGPNIYEKNIVKNIKKKIDALKVGKNDLIFFHYTGHGFNKGNNNDSLPSYFLAKEKKVDIDPSNERELEKYYNKYTIEMRQMDQWLKAKGARSTFILSDCCNNDIFALWHSDRVGSKKGGAKKGGDLTLSPLKCKALFYDTKFSVLIAAAQKSQKSWSTNETGSFCTKAYLDNFKNLLSFNTPASIRLSWNPMLNIIKTTTKDIVNRSIIEKPIQNPIVINQ